MYIKCIVDNITDELVLIDICNKLLLTEHIVQLCNSNGFVSDGIYWYINVDIANVADIQPCINYNRIDIMNKIRIFNIKKIRC